MLDDACCTMHTGGMSLERILERLFIGIGIRVASSQINGSINRRRNARGNRARPANYQPRFRRTPRIGPIFWSTFFVATTILILLNH